jgi:hypothetical protein
MEINRNPPTEIKELKGVFIASSYSGRTRNRIARNVEMGERAFLAMLLRGQTPYLITLAHFPATLGRIEFGIEVPKEVYLKIAFRVMENGCDSLLYLAKSPGTDAELEHANSLGYRIFNSIEEVPYASPETIEETKGWIRKVGESSPLTIDEVNELLIRGIRRNAVPEE